MGNLDLRVNELSVAPVRGVADLGQKHRPRSTSLEAFQGSEIAVASEVGKKALTLRGRLWGESLPQVQRQKAETGT